MEYNESLPGLPLEQAQDSHARKPFWGSRGFSMYCGHFVQLLRVFESLPLSEGSRLLELGCGAGWMAEFLAIAGYQVLGTSIAPLDIALADKKAEAFRIKGLPGSLTFRVCPMEYVDEHVPAVASYDGVYAYQALHHCFDWRKTLQATHRCLKPGGWVVLADEPNWFHTFRAYRVNKLSHTHEVGFSRKTLVAALLETGYEEIRVLRPRFHNCVTPLWIAARKSI